MQFDKAEIFRAIEQNQFIPYFQPLVDLREGNIRGFEVLARWQHPMQGLVAPNHFISQAEKHGLMNSLSISLFKQAFASAHVIPAGIGLSVNLSPAQLHDRVLPDLLHRLADDAHFDLKRLTVEITESALLDDLEVAARTAAELKALGIRLALDDFGTGYSSLLHLQALPFDELKVDMSFVRSMVESRQSRKITAAVVSLGISLGLQTVGEGVEDPSQANLLLWQGCTLGQGWLYGRPQPAEALPGVLAQPRLGPATEPASSAIADISLSLEGHPTERLSQLQAIYDSAPVGLCFLDCDLRYVNLNPRLAAMNGAPVQSFLGRKVADVVPALYAQVEVHLKRALKGMACAGAELTAPPATTGGPATTRLASYQPVRDETGEVIGVCISIQDISALKDNEEALRYAETTLRAVLDTAPVGIVFAEVSTGRVLKGNSRAEEILGCNFDLDTLWSAVACESTDIEGRSIDPFDRPLARAMYRGETTTAREIVLCRPDSSTLIVSLSAVPVRCGAGNVVGGVLTMQELDEVDALTWERQKLLDAVIRLTAAPARSIHRVLDRAA